MSGPSSIFDFFDSPWGRTAVALVDNKIVIRKYGTQWMLMIKGLEEPVKTPDFETARYTAAWCVDLGRRHNIDLEKLLQ